MHSVVRGACGGVAKGLYVFKVSRVQFWLMTQGRVFPLYMSCVCKAMLRGWWINSFVLPRTACNCPATQSTFFVSSFITPNSFMIQLRLYVVSPDHNFLLLSVLCIK